MMAFCLGAMLGSFLTALIYSRLVNKVVRDWEKSFNDSNARWEASFRQLNEDWARSHRGLSDRWKKICEGWQAAYDRQIDRNN